MIFQIYIVNFVRFYKIIRICLIPMWFSGKRGNKGTIFLYLLIFFPILWCNEIQDLEVTEFWMIYYIFLHMYTKSKLKALVPPLDLGQKFFLKKTVIYWMRKERFWESFLWMVIVNKLNVAAYNVFLNIIAFETFFSNGCLVLMMTTHSIGSSCCCKWMNFVCFLVKKVQVLRLCKPVISTSGVWIS